MKRWIAGFLSLVMMASMVTGFVPVAYADEVVITEQEITEQKKQQIIPDKTGGTNTDGSVTISKTIEPTGIENYFDITLTVTEKEIVEETATDVVIVMDISNTMNYNHDNEKPENAASARLAEAKAAAQEFVLEYASAPNLPSERNLALVTFNTDANILIDLGKVNQSMLSTISSITAPDGDRRYTNIEGGLRLADNILKKSTAKYKYVVLITDGFPTTYTEKETGGGRSMQGYLTNGVDRFKDRERNRVCAGTDYSDEAALRAQNTAASMKKSGINIVTIGIDVGSQTIQMYLDRWKNATFATVDRPKGIHPNGYVIGSATSTKDYEAWLGGTLNGNGLGGGPNVTTGFYKSESQAELDAAFDSILSTIEVTSSRSLAEGKVVDPMGEYAEFIAFYDQSGALKDSLKGEHAEGKENTAGYEGTASANAIDWDLEKSGYTIQTEKTEDGKTVVSYTYTLKYRVRLENEVLGFVEGATCPTNDGAKLTYEDPTEPDEEKKEKELEFPDPSVKGYLGELTFTKTDANGTSLQGAEFTLTHNAGNCAVCKAAGNTVAIADHTVASDANGVVSFANIPSGHDYTLTETKAPAGYQKAAGALGTVTVAYGKTAFTKSNALVSGSGADLAVKNEPLGSAELQLTATKTLDGNAPEGGAFTFLLKDAAGNPLDTKTNDENGKVTFKEMTYDAPGTYVYEIVEDAGDAENVIYDKTVYHVTVTVAPDNAENPTKYVATVSKVVDNKGNTIVDDQGNPPKNVTFANVSRQPVGVVLTAQKNLTGDSIKDWKAPFQFTLTADDTTNVKNVKIKSENSETPSDWPASGVTATNGDAGVVTFPEIIFSAAGTYTFFIDEEGVTQKSDTAHYMEYDPSVYEVKVVIGAPTDTGYYKVDSITYTKYDNAEDTVGAAYTGSVPVFTNVHHDGGTADFSFTKVDEAGSPLTGAVFTLTHAKTCGEHEISDSDFVSNATSGTDGVVTFENVPSGHSYVLEESEPLTANGISYQKALPRTVVVSFGDVYIDGVLVADAGSVKIVNAPATEARVEFKAQKTLLDQDGNTIAVPNNTFTFELRDSANNLIAQKKNTDSANAELAAKHVDEVIFDPIFYKSKGTYTYTLKELHLSDDELVYYDRTVYNITVEVTQHGDELKATTSYKKAETETAYDPQSAPMAFVNYLRAPVTVSLGAIKQMSGTSEMLDKDAFTFELRNAATDALVATATNGANGEISFTDVLTFDRAGEYKYYIVERQGSEEHIVYDNSRCDVTITVSAPKRENDEGEYAVSVTYKKDGVTYTQNGVTYTSVEELPVFTNSYMAVLRLQKTNDATDDAKVLLAGAKFTLTHDSDSCCNDTIAPLTAISRSKDDALTYKGDAVNLVFAEIPSGHTYILEETSAPDGYHAAPKHKVVVKKGEVSIYDWDAGKSEWKEAELTQGVHAIVDYPEAKVEIEGQKILAGRDWQNEEDGDKFTDKFTIVLQHGLQPKAEEIFTTVVTSETNGFFSFKDREMLTYTIDELDPVDNKPNKKAKEFTYYVYEQLPDDAVNGKLNGITYDQTVFKVVVNVEGEETEHKVNVTSVSYTAGKFVKDGENTVFVADENGTRQGIHFTNTYSAEPVTVNLRGTKALTGRALHDAEFFLATYAADENWTTQEQPIRYVSNQKDAETGACSSVIFHDRTFTTPGVFRYVVREINNTLGGVVYDTTEYRLTITVTDDHAGHLQAKMEIEGYLYDAEDGKWELVDGTKRTVSTEDENAPRSETADVVLDGFEFSNTYTLEEGAVANLHLSATKVHDGYLHNGLFRFALYQTDSTFAITGDPLQTASNDAAGKITFDPIQYVYDSTTGNRNDDTTQRVLDTYYYAVCEIDRDKYAHINYDDTIYYVTVTLYDNHRGGVGVSYSIRNSKSDSDEDVLEMIFYNSEKHSKDPGPTPTPTPVDPGTPGSPNTGDSSNPALWIGLMAGGLAAVIALLLVTRKRKDDDDTPQ
ncbi:MAG: VWA domain-containing protein [Oscillospiraceae bacterium]|nr:VWA domain-containing protein [Oscillospiraceae bacterium]